MKLKNLIIASMALAPVVQSCSDVDFDPYGITVREPGNEPGGEFTIPDYADDYADISSWSNHTKWNLANVHDPSVAYWDGWYYMFGTDASYGNEHDKATMGRHFQGKRSRDLVTWYYVQGPMNEAPAWVAEKLNEFRAKMGLEKIEASDIAYGYWAPVIRKVTVDGKERLRMYYSIVCDNYIKTGKPSTETFDGSWSERAFIGMCETTDPASGIWEDKGFVTCSSSDKGRDGWARQSTGDWDAYFYYNAIDPTYIVDPSGKHYLIHGSWHSGFALLEIDPSTGKPVNELGDPWADNAADLTARYGVRIGTRTDGSRWQGSEAPEIVYKDGYYYLFMAYDGLDVPYNTRVVRSTSIEGPYTDITGRNFTNGRGDTYPIVTHPYKFKEGDGWVGISHCCVFKAEDSDKWFYMSQGRLPAGAGGNAYANALMMGHVRQIVWCPASPSATDDLWPLALPERYAAVPDQGKISSTDLVGKWEHINLVYNYANQDMAEDAYLEINADGTISGAMTGTWTYDEAKKWLTIKTATDEVVVCVEREVDWEASPRKVTLVYAGTAAGLNATWWGKKVE